MPPPFPVLPGQHGLATYRQLIGAGWSPTQIHDLTVRVGARVLPTLYVGHRGPLGADGRLTAAWLWAGADAVLTGAHALFRHGVPLAGALGRPLFLVPKPHRRRSVDAAVTARSDRPFRARLLDGLPTVGLERALVDAGLFGDLAPEQLRAATIAALQRRLTTGERVRAELGSARRNGSGAVRGGVSDFELGAWSLPEASLRRLLCRRRPGLEVLFNPRLLTLQRQLVGVPDAYLPDVGVAILVHSREFHDGTAPDGRERWELTVEADSAYAAVGVPVAAVAPSVLRDQPDRFLTRLDQVIAAQGGRRPNRVLVEGA